MLRRWNDEGGHCRPSLCAYVKRMQACTYIDVPREREREREVGGEIEEGMAI